MAISRIERFKESHLLVFSYKDGKCQQDQIFFKFDVEAIYKSPELFK